MEKHARPTFKVHPSLWEPSHRPLSPEPPHVEPLSPTIVPFMTPFQSLFFQHPQVVPKPRQRTSATRVRRTSTKSTRNQSVQHMRKASGTIDDLAQAALAISGPPPALGPIKEVKQTRQELETQLWGAPPDSHQVGTRPYKRARSEAELYGLVGDGQPVEAESRPTSSYAVLQKRLSESNSTQLADAALLLDFASHGSYERRQLCDHESEFVNTSSSISHDPVRKQPSVPAFDTPPSQLQSQASLRMTPDRVPAHDEAKFAPVGKGSNDTLDLADADESGEMLPMTENVESRPLEVSAQDGTQTPSEGKSEGMVEMNSEETVDSVLEEKPKTRRGWPKGKARGPRKSGPASAKPKTAGSRRARKAQAATDDAILKPRRNSAPNFEGSQFSATSIKPSRSRSVPAEYRFATPKSKSNAGRKALPKFTKDTTCETCKISRETTHGELDQWISCNGCQNWFHSDCAGFKNERDVRDVDKFFCTTCQPKHGATTFVRKSSRAHAAVDYAGLNQGVLKTSDECNEHHYIQPIKDGSFTFDPEAFPRMRPELVNREYFERSACFNEPILIPAEFNPKPTVKATLGGQERQLSDDLDMRDADLLDDFEYETVHDDGQDRLDMVIPQDLTIRRVSELVGPDYPLEVIDVKDQNIEGTKWNLGKWADYYEADGEKAIRNVISLEVAHTKLGRLLRRPQIVRQIDLQDNVWPEDEAKKSVAFYCLMSVADSYTDFHIDFGGSSVYYHILRGSKTFFFIPPKPKHLKAYEDWNNSHEQNFTFLPEITKECYRVDLFEGDTMLIPSGWIHAVWTPSNSLVIGGNFLTHLHYSMQFRIVDVERANKVGAKFRYPKFQKVMWYSVLQYLERDPLPESVRDCFYKGQQFKRKTPLWMDFDAAGDRSNQGSEDHNARYYSQSELDGLSDLVSYIFRTVMISLDRIESITAETRKNVISSIPKGHGDPLDLAKTFALWVAWKRGNEDPPAWAHPDACLPEKEGTDPKKLSAKALRQLQRQEAFEAFKIAPERQSIRQKQREEKEAVRSSPAPESIEHQRLPEADAFDSPGTGPKRAACDTCRKRRIRCKHKVEQTSGREFHSVVIPKTEPSMDPPLMFSSAPMVNTQSQPPIQTDLETIMVAPATTHLTLAAPMVPMQVSTQNMLDGSVKRGRSKACLDCRKSKRRCVHDENGNVDPQKEKMLPVPRGSMQKKRKNGVDETSDAKKPKAEPSHREESSHDPANFDYTSQFQVEPPSHVTAPPPDASMHRQEGTGAQNGFALDPQLFSTQSNQTESGDLLSGISNNAQQENSISAFDTRPMGSETTSTHITAAPPMSILDTESSPGGVSKGFVDQAALGETQSRPPGILNARDVGTVPPAILQKHTMDDDQALSSGVSMAVTTPITTESAVQGGAPSPLAPQGFLSAKDSDSSPEPQLPRTESSNAGEFDHASSNDTTTDQTPSANDPPSLSSASSPLSAAADDWPEAIATPVGPPFEPFVRQSRRQSRPVERFAAQTFATLKTSAETTALISAPASVGRKRKSSSATPAPPAPGSRASSASVKGSKTPKLSVEKPAVALKVENGVEMDEDEKYARLLAGESFGLRNRRSVGS